MFWREYGHHGQNEQITAIWGQFREVPPPSWTFGAQQRGKVVCSRCGKPATPGPREHLAGSRPENAPEELARATSYVTASPLDGTIVVRTYAAGRLAAESRLTPRRALLLAQDVLNAAVIAGHHLSGPDEQVFKAPRERRVANAPR